MMMRRPATVAAAAVTAVLAASASVATCAAPGLPRERRSSGDGLGASATADCFPSNRAPSNEPNTRCEAGDVATGGGGLRAASCEGGHASAGSGVVACLAPSKLTVAVHASTSTCSAYACHTPLPSRFSLLPLPSRSPAPLNSTCEHPARPHRNTSSHGASLCVRFIQRRYEPIGALCRTGGREEPQLCARAAPPSYRSRAGPGSVCES